MKKGFTAKFKAAAIFCAALLTAGTACAAETEEWDKTFPKSGKVEHSKVTFRNRYGITLKADLYKPKGAQGRLAAIAVCGPFGAVKEQASGLYAQTMAERGFLTIAFDPSFTGESGGEPRYMASPDINTEDFMAAVDYLSVREDVDPDKIGIIGICGWGGMALNAAALDTRVKAALASTMYDMARVNANGYFDAEDSADARYAKKQAMNVQARGRPARQAARGRAAVRKGLLRLLQDGARLSSAFAELQRRLERHGLRVVPQPADTALQQRNPQRGARHARREGPFLLLQPRRLRRDDKGQPIRGQQRAADNPRRVAHRPLRQPRRDTVRQDYGVLYEVSE